MQTLKLGQSDLNVTPICLGTMTFGEQVAEGDAHAIMDRAHEHGINFFDTANVYGWGENKGRTEEILGRWLRGKREKFIVATKCAGEMGPAPWQRGTSRKHVFAAIEASLDRERRSRGTSLRSTPARPSSRRA